MACIGLPVPGDRFLLDAASVVQISGPVPKALGNLENLRELQLQNNRLTGMGVQHRQACWSRLYIPSLLERVVSTHTGVILTLWTRLMHKHMTTSELVHLNIEV